MRFHSICSAYLPFVLFVCSVGISDIVLSVVTEEVMSLECWRIAGMGSQNLNGQRGQNGGG